MIWVILPEFWNLEAPLASKPVSVSRSGCGSGNGNGGQGAAISIGLLWAAIIRKS